MIWAQTMLGWALRLRDIETGIRTNVPRSNNPEAFHERKSELANETRMLRDEIENHVQQAGGQR